MSRLSSIIEQQLQNQSQHPLTSMTDAHTPVSVSASESFTDSFIKDLEAFKVRVIKRLPRGSRTQAPTALKEFLQRVLGTPDSVEAATAHAFPLLQAPTSRWGKAHQSHVKLEQADEKLCRKQPSFPSRKLSTTSKRNKEEGQTA